MAERPQEKKSNDKKLIYVVADSKSKSIKDRVISKENAVEMRPHL